MKIALAQIKPFKGSVGENVNLHKRFVNIAGAHNCDLILFPELSLTAYEPELSEELAGTADDERLQEFQEQSDIHGLVIAVGMPLRSASGIHIGIVFFQQQSPPQVYFKQHLHEDELPYFVAGTNQLILNVKGKIIAPAICYESLQEAHLKRAITMGAGIYLASVAKAQSGIEKACQHFSLMSKKYGIPILMVNCIGDCDHFRSAGQSSVWDTFGKLVGQLDDKSEGLIFYETPTNNFSRIQL